MEVSVKFILAAVNAKYIHSNPAIYSLRACVEEEHRKSVELAEYTINQPMQEILADLYARKPDAIGFSCYIWNWRMVREMLAELPKILPGTALWLGGPEVSWGADVILDSYPQLSGIMAGEGEDTFRELMSFYMGEGQLDKIRGLYLHSGYTGCRELTDFSKIPFLYDDLEPFENRIIYYESSRGCPFDCSYCLSSVEKKVRFRDISVVKRELQFFLDHKVRQVKFVDRTFNCRHEHAMEIWKYIYEHDNGVTNFHFEISADILRQEETALLGRFRPGLAQLEIGVQSVNPRTLEAVHRRTDLERLEKNVADIRRGGNVHQHLDLIAGLPYEDYESFRKSFNRVYRMRPQQLQLGFLKVLKGSGMWEKAGEYGIRYLEQPPYEVLCTKWLSYAQVLKLKRVEEMVEVYYNSAQFVHTMCFLERAFGDPFAMYETLAEFFDGKGWTTATFSRIRRYEMLLEFVKKQDPGRLAAYRELLTYDIYLRENLKSRPDFAAELSGYQEKIRNFYEREEREHRFLTGYEGRDRRQLGKMTHLEPFTYPVWDREQMAQGGAGGQQYFVLFDYQARDPVSLEARTQCVSI